MGSRNIAVCAVGEGFGIDSSVALLNPPYPAGAEGRVGAEQGEAGGSGREEEGTSEEGREGEVGEVKEGCKEVLGKARRAGEDEGRMLAALGVLPLRRAGGGLLVLAGDHVTIPLGHEPPRIELSADMASGLLW